jgi:hypothetical protein
MPAGVAGFFEDKTVHMGAIAVFAVSALMGLAFWLRRKRPTIEELERERRLEVSRLGRMADGVVLEVHDRWIEYMYSVRGIEYSASQDFGALEKLLPDERHRLVGAVSLKYMEQNPANSIVLSEEWSGLRVSSRVAVRPQPQV